jgi:hypothetical protein
VGVRNKPMPKRRVEKIWIEAELCREDHQDAEEETEVLVMFRDRSTWTATFATYKHLELSDEIAVLEAFLSIATSCRSSR